MKTNTNLIPTQNIYFAILIFLFSFSFLTVPISCKKKSPNDDVKIIIDYNLIKTSFSFMFKDATTNELIGFDDAKIVLVEIGGQDAENILDITGIKRSEYNSVGGVLGLGLHPDFLPSKTSPIKFFIRTKIEGYVNYCKLIQVSNTGNFHFEIKLINIETPPSGVATIVDNSGIASNGVVESIISIATPKVSGTNTRALLTVPNGIILLDKSGSPLDGPLTTTLVYYSNLDDKALESFPGGLNTTVNHDGVISDMSFFSAGCADVEIKDGSGRIAKTSQSVTREDNTTLIYEVSPETYNPEFSRLVDNNDTIPFWTFDMDNGEWDYEFTDTIIGPNNEGNYEVSVTLNGFTPKNIDWPVSPCDFKSKLKFNCDYLDTGDPVSLLIWLHWNDYAFLGDQIVKFRYGEIVDLDVGIPFVPNVNDLSSILSIQDLSIANSFASTHIVNLCDEQTYELNLFDVIQSTDTTTVRVEISGSCPSNPDVIFKPSFPFWYMKTDDLKNVIPSNMTSGIAILKNVTIGDSYTFWTYYDGNIWIHTTIIEESGLYQYEIALTQNMCDTWQ